MNYVIYSKKFPGFALGPVETENILRSAMRGAVSEGAKGVRVHRPWIGDWLPLEAFKYVKPFGIGV